jgi:hypothetical protein
VELGVETVDMNYYIEEMEGSLCGREVKIRTILYELDDSVIFRCVTSYVIANR